MDLRDTILDADDIKIVPMDVPEWNITKEDIGIKVMSGTERDRFETSIYDSKGKVHSWYGGNCHCHCNPSPLNGGKDISLDVKQIQRLIDATTRISYSQTTIH